MTFWKRLQWTMGVFGSNMQACLPVRIRHYDLFFVFRIECMHMTGTACTEQGMNLVVG